MTANEIRKWHQDLENSAFTKVEIIRARARIEIAAQLAEINESLQKFNITKTKRNKPQEMKSISRHTSNGKRFWIDRWLISVGEDHLAKFVPDKGEGLPGDLEIGMVSRGTMGSGPISIRRVQ